MLTNVANAEASEKAVQQTKNLKTEIKEATHMYIINETVLAEKIAKEKFPEMMQAHRAWFLGHYTKGDFLLVGKYNDMASAGIIISKATNRAALEEILKEDVFYADKLAVYDVHEFTAGKIAANITSYEGK